MPVLPCPLVAFVLTAGKPLIWKTGCTSSESRLTSLCPNSQNFTPPASRAGAIGSEASAVRFRSWPIVVHRESAPHAANASPLGSRRRLGSAPPSRRDTWGARSMSKPTIANSPGRPGDRSLTVPGRPGVVGDQDLASPTSLEAERCGLLVAPVGRLEADQPRSSRLEPDRRMAEWIASNLDLASPPAPETRSAWNRLIEGLPGLKRKRISQRGEPAPPTAHDVWARFHVAYRRGITVVRIADKSLVKEPQIRELACDLFDLIAAGNHRIVLNFRATQRLASWVVVVASEARRRCAAGDGGALKICGLTPDLASIFPIAGMTQGIELYDDEAAALDSPWPEGAGPRALPVEILTALTRAADLPPIRGGAPAEAAREAHKPVRPKPAPNFDDLMADRVAAPETEVWLLVQIGGVKGRAVRIHGPNFVIGRDATCQLRLGSAMVSKLHAAILSRDDGVFVRDLGSTNGTIINGQAIRSGDLEVKSGDRIQIGPVVATLAVGRSHGEVAAGRRAGRRLAANRRHRLSAVPRRGTANLGLPFHRITRQRAERGSNTKSFRMSW